MADARHAQIVPRRVERIADKMVHGPGRVVAQARRLHREALHVRKLVASPVFARECAVNVRSRLGKREDAFLGMVERAIFNQAHSPYRRLFEVADHDLASVRQLVGQLGVEGALRRLSHDGVFVAIEEFKGIRPARRGTHEFRFAPSDFNNPLVQSGLLAASGGTRSRRIPTIISPEDHRVGAEHFALALDAYGLSARPVAVWMAHGHGASMWAIAALAALRVPSVEWFTLAKGGSTSVTLLSRLAPLYGLTLPRLIHAPFQDASRVLSWVTSRQGDGQCGIFTIASLAVRLALEAKARNVSLGNVTFITIGEPLTPAKLRAVAEVGGRAYSSLGFTEFGRATYGCANPQGADDSHICRDAVSVVQRRRQVDHLGTEVDALLFTALWPHARKVLLNMETGDYATIIQRRCGCPLEAIGWVEHMHDIRSFEKLNAVGRLFFGSTLYALVEEVLPTRFGGQPADYQLVEAEDAQGLTRLSVLVHPRLGPLDERAILECVEETLSGLAPVQARTWHDAGIVQVRRQPPVLTAAGKLMPLHHLGMPTQESA